MTSPILSTLSEDGREVVADFVTTVVEDEPRMRQKTAEFILYLLGEKPATEFTKLALHDPGEGKEEVMKSTPESYSGILNLIDTLDIPHHKQYKQLNEQSSAVYFECVDDASDPIPSILPDDASEEFHRKWGEHYGYPEPAIDGFVNNECLRIYSNSDDVQELRRNAEALDIDWSDVRRLALVSFLPPSSEDGLRVAIRRGETYEVALHQVADEYGCDAFAELSDGLIDGFDRRLAD